VARPATRHRNARVPQLVGYRKPCSPGIQRATELIDVGAWESKSKPEDGASYREKAWLTSPKDSEFSFLRAGYQHLWKQGISRAPEQFWNEVLAYRLGQYLGISVPPTHVAFNSLTGEVGALSEFFSYDEGRPVHFRSGSALIPGTIDRRTAQPYNFETISSWLTFLERNHLMLSDWREFWSQAFLLDALMGNTDRHIDNWGAVVSWNKLGSERYKLAPLFDNGTSMGYEYPAERIKLILDGRRVPGYINRGTHQMFWRPDDAKRLSHPDLLRRFYDEFPAQRAGIRARLRISDRTIERVVRELAEFRCPFPLKPIRARWMIELLKHRRDRLIACIVQRDGVARFPGSTRSTQRPASERWYAAQVEASNPKKPMHKQPVSANLSG
jgi:hypothetical protein